MKKLLLCFLMCLCSFQAFALKIVASVNDEIITDVDVADRQALLNGLFQLKSSFNETLDSLIEEKVKLLSAQKLKISVTPEQIEEGIAYLERQNGFDKGQLLAIMREKKLSENALVSQIKADISWVSAVGQLLPEQPKISNQKVANTRKKMKQDLMQERYLLAEIFIPFDNDEQAAFNQAQSLFDRIVVGESFTELAVKYSKGKTAAMMGDLGWVKTDELDKSIGEVLPHMQAGQLSKPIKGKKGYYVILMRDFQPALESDEQEVWQVSQFVTTKEAYPYIKDSLNQASSSCMLFTKYASDNGVEGSHSGAMPEMVVSRLPNELKDLLIDKPVGEMVGPIDMGPYAVFVMKCGVRTTSILPDNETIKQQLFMQEMEKKSQELLKQERKKMLVKKK